MNPDTKFFLEEMRKEFAEQKKEIRKEFMDHDTKWEARIAAVEKQKDDRIDALESAAAAFESWKPTIESSVQIVKTEVQKLSKHWDRTVKDKADAGLFPPPSFTVPPFGSVSPRPSAGGEADGSEGHRGINHSRDVGLGSAATYSQIPGKGTTKAPPPPPPPPPPRFTSFHSHGLGGSIGGNFGRAVNSTSKLPKLNFPEFTGDNPRLWISRCENYFDMYEVESYRWIQIASMYLTDAAARWFQSVHHRLKSASWHEFATLLLERFGREQKELLIRQLFHIKQSGTVAEYVEKFAELVDQLTAYGHVIEPVYHAMRFVDGLRDDIRALVSLHRPLDFDTVASLALLQEDVGSNFRTSRKHDYSYGSKSVPKGPQPLPPPPRIDKAASAPVLTEEKKICEGKTLEERMAALRAFRRAKDLCIRCAEKWHRDHKCSPTVQLHVVQELLDVFQLDDIDHLSATTENVDQLFAALSKEAISGQDGPRTMRLHGIIQGKPILIFVDSGSTHTFISQALSSSLQRTSQMLTDV
jgi:hypothetical protein